MSETLCNTVTKGHHNNQAAIKNPLKEAHGRSQMDARNFDIGKTIPFAESMLVNRSYHPVKSA